MSTTLATYIALPGNAAEAFEHWHMVFGGELDLMRYGDMHMEGMPFEPNPEHVAHAVLTTPGGQIAGGDAMEDGNDYLIRGTLAASFRSSSPVGVRWACPLKRRRGASGTERCSTDSA